MNERLCSRSRSLGISFHRDHKIVLFLRAEFLSSRLPPVPEEDVFHGTALNSSGYPELDLMAPMNQVSGMSDSSSGAVLPSPQQSSTGGQSSMQTEEPSITLQHLQYTAKIYTQAQQQQAQQQQQEAAAAAAAGVFRNNV